MSLFPKDWALNSARPIERFYQPQFLDYHLSSHNVEQVNFVCYISSCKLAQNHQYSKVFCEIYNFFFLLALLNRNLVRSYILDMTKEKRRNKKWYKNVPVETYFVIINFYRNQKNSLLLSQNSIQIPAPQTPPAPTKRRKHKNYRNPQYPQIPISQNIYFQIIIARN